MHPENIQQLIEAGLSQCRAIVDSNDNIHFSAIVISAEFDGESRLRRQQKVYATLGGCLLDGSIHALSVRTYTPGEWKIASKDMTHG